MPFAGLVVTGVLPRRTPRIPDSRMTFVTWSRPISAGSRPRANNRACVLRYPYTAMKKSAWISSVAGQRLVPGGHAADGPGSEHAVAARRDGPAVQRSGQHPADRPDPETVLEFVDVSDHQRRVGSSRAAKKADAVVNISFARLNRATSARKLFNSAIASSADCLVSAATVASVLLRQRRSVSGATPGSLATCSIALVSDEYEPRDSVNSLTAFALNSGVYLVPFVMVPSSPIELGEMRNKNQFISVSDLTIDQTPMGWIDSGVTTDTAACSINKQ